MTGPILVIGATGLLGQRVFRRAAAAGATMVGTYFARPADTAGEWLDIRDRAAVRDLLRRVRPGVVVHTATGRDRDDWRTIADGAANVAVAAAAAGIRLVHVSSDAVFSGRDIHYDETALPDPVNRYGAAKAAAETAVRAVAPDAAVVRTSLILGDGDSSHEQLIHRLAAGRVDGALFTDEIRKPIHADDLADALLELAAGDHRGVLNVAGVDPISRYDLGVLVAVRDGLDPASLPSGRSAELNPGRPLDVQLRLDRAAALLRTRLRGAREFVAPPAATPGG